MESGQIYAVPDGGVDYTCVLESEIEILRKRGLAQVSVFCRPAVFFLLYSTQDSPLSIMYKYQDAGVFCFIAVSCEIYVRRFEATILISMGGLP